MYISLKFIFRKRLSAIHGHSNVIPKIYTTQYWMRKKLHSESINKINYTLWVDCHVHFSSAIPLNVNKTNEITKTDLKARTILILTENSNENNTNAQYIRCTPCRSRALSKHNHLIFHRRKPLFEWRSFPAWRYLCWLYVNPPFCSIAPLNDIWPRLYDTYSIIIQ